MRIAIACFLLLLSCAAPAWADKIPNLEFVPGYIPQSQQDTLNTRRQQLETELAQFQADGDTFNALDANDQSDAQYNELKSRRASYVQAAVEFNKDIMTIADAEEARIRGGIMNVAREEGWDKKSWSILRQP